MLNARFLHQTIKTVTKTSVPEIAIELKRYSRQGSGLPFALQV
jgi:hypothetical protein